MSRCRAAADWQSGGRRYRGKHRCQGRERGDALGARQLLRASRKLEARYADELIGATAGVSIVQLRAVQITGESLELLGRSDRWP